MKTIHASTIPLVLALAAGCGGGSDFTSSSDGGSSGGSSGSAGAAGGGGTGGNAGAAGSGSGGASGSAGAAGSAGTGGSAGDGGTVEAGANCTDSSACNAHEYCGQDNVCHSCGDLSSFHFDDPEALDQINNAHPNDYLRFPRALGEKTALLYTVEDAIGSARAIWVTGDFTSSAGAAMGAPVDQDKIGEGGPLPVAPAASGALAGMTFFFDRGVASSFNREIVGGLIDATGAVSGLKALPDPVNLAKGGVSYSFAFAPNTGRAWWVSTRSGTFSFDVWTTSFASTPSTTPTQVSLTTDPANCPLAAYDATPWVTPDGSLMLFTSTEYYGDCTHKGSTVDTFFVRLDASGKATGIAKTIDVDLQNVDDMMPSMSPDMCWLYFASNRNGASKPRLYRAHRK